MALPKILALIMIVSTMLSAGLQVDRERLIETFRNIPLLAKALLANFVLVPLFAAFIVRASAMNRDVAIGILLMAMAPGVPFLVNSGGRKQGGSLAFALEIAFLFSALSVITIPLTAALIFPPDSLAQVPAAHFLTTLLLFQLVPLVLGALLAPRLSAPAASRAVRVLHLVFLAAVAVLVVLLGPKLWEAVTSVYGYGNLLWILTIGLFSAATGWLLGGENIQYRRTLSVATLMRNIGLCALVGTSDFAGTLVVPTILTYFAVTFVVSLPIRIFYMRTAKTAAGAR